MSLKLYNSSYKLGEICLQITDGKHGDCENQENSGYYFVSVKDIDDDEINYSNARQITKFDFEDTDRRTKLENEDILITNSGTIGKFVFVNSPLSRKTTFQKSVAIIKPNKNKIIPKFLYYYLISEKRQLVEYAGGTTQKNLLLRDIRNFEVKIPDESRQKKIIMILNDIDQLISVNKKLNKNLEHLLYNIFYYWFISFEKFNDVDFIETEIGKIPKGWEVGILKDILTLTKNTINPRKTNGLPYLPIDIIPMNSLGILELKSDEEANSSLITFDKNDILIGAMRVYFHRVVVSPCSGVTRSTCFVLKPKKETYLSYSLLLCNLNQTIHYAQNTSKGTTMPYAVWNNGLGDMEILIPPENILNEFHMIVFPIIKKIRDSYNEINKLTKLRDTLLPKLMSGEIDVSKINCDLELKYNYMKYLFNQIHTQMSKSVV